MLRIQDNVAELASVSLVMTSFSLLITEENSAQSCVTFYPLITLIK